MDGWIKARKYSQAISMYRGNMHMEHTLQANAHSMIYGSSMNTTNPLNHGSADTNIVNANVPCTKTTRIGMAVLFIQSC